MKKLMKAIAFATVMCMLLSTAAFAAESSAERTEDYVLDVTVVSANATASEQVALLIVAENAQLTSLSNSDILYVNQAASVAAETGYEASFDVKIDSETEVEKVDVYAGYATAADGGPEKVATGLSLKEVAAITVVAGTATIINDVEAEAEENGVALDVTTDNDKGALVILPVTFTTNGTAVTKMFWSFGIDTDDDGAADDYRYVAGDIEKLGLGTIIDNSAVQLGAAFANGTKTVKGLDIVSANAIFLIGDQDYHTNTDPAGLVAEKAAKNSNN